MDEIKQDEVITADGERPKKRFYRQRAHNNPMSVNSSFETPLKPSDYDWAPHYPLIPEVDRRVDFLDIGCGYGGLTVALARAFPDQLVLGMEIRDKVWYWERWLREEMVKF